MDTKQSVMFGVEGPNYPWSTILDVAVTAEKVGFDSYWTPDHLIATGVRRWDALEAWAMLTALAVHTKKIKLATGVSDTYRYHPASLAQKVATLDVISGGRAILGIGIGEAMNLVPYGIPYDKPIARTEEALEIIRRLWSEDLFDYKGNYYKLRKAFIQPKPSVPVSETKFRPTVPIFVAASSPRTMEMVAKYGDGWLPANLPTNEYGEDLAKIKTMAKKFGRDPEAIEPAHFTYVAIGKDRDATRKAVLPQAKMLLLSRPKIIEKLGFTPPTYDFEMTFKLVFPEHAKAWVETAQKLPDEVVDKSPYIIGTPEDAIEKIDEYVKAGCRHFVINFQVSASELKETSKLFAEKVIPHFKHKH
jgi:alkanesulfonate monooxygenase SsuD/methylene tetrahydromethanopterin reductase-like flavin-dependent oxidoreductase (luciferase family)